MLRMPRRSLPGFGCQGRADCRDAKQNWVLRTLCDDLTGRIIVASRFVLWRGVPMVVVPGLSESLRAVRKRIDAMNTRLSVDVASSARRGRCPSCSHGSSRWHGQYWRHLKDQPCMGRSVNLSVQVRRFKCVNPQCARTTFVEQIDSLAAANQRRTVGLNRAWSAVAQSLGGSAAARLSAKLEMPVSRDTLLRQLRRLGSEVTMEPPVVVGIDDWAITRGHRYGTIVVDLVRLDAVRSRSWTVENPRAWPTGSNAILRSRCSPATVPVRTDARRCTRPL